jgi:hypothetical protein
MTVTLSVKVPGESVTSRAGMAFSEISRLRAETSNPVAETERV